MSTQARILAIDVGNSFIKFAFVSATHVRARPSLPTANALRRAGIESWIRKRNFAAIDAIMVSSVVPDLDRRLANALREQTELKPVFVNYAHRFPFRLAVTKPSTVGIDRLCSVAGALSPRAQSIIVIDVGSAITVDLIHRRRYLGGVIMVGPMLGLRALADHAAKLPVIRADELRSSASRRSGGTRASMILGARVGAAGAIEKAVLRLRAEAGKSVRVVVTGGAAQHLKRHLPSSWRYADSLVPRGLFAIWQLNR